MCELTVLVINTFHIAFSFIKDVSNLRYFVLTKKLYQRYMLITGHILLL